MFPSKGREVNDYNGGMDDILARFRQGFIFDEPEPLVFPDGGSGGSDDQS